MIVRMRMVQTPGSVQRSNSPILKISWSTTISEPAWLGTSLLHPKEPKGMGNNASKVGSINKNRYNKTTKTTNGGWGSAERALTRFIITDNLVWVSLTLLVCVLGFLTGGGLQHLICVLFLLFVLSQASRSPTRVPGWITKGNGSEAMTGETIVADGAKARAQADLMAAVLRQHASSAIFSSHWIPEHGLGLS